MTEFAVKSMVREIPAVQIGDIVYVTMFFTIGEIVSTSTSGLHRIRLAKEVKEMPTSTTQAASISSRSLMLRGSSATRMARHARKQRRRCAN